MNIKISKEGSKQNSEQENESPVVAKKGSDLSNEYFCDKCYAPILLSSLRKSSEKQGEESQDCQECPSHYVCYRCGTPLCLSDAGDGLDA